MTIINATIYTMEGEPIQCGYLTTEGGKIVAVGSMEDFAGDPARCIDAKGGILTPGFIDPHTHLGIFEEGICFEGEDGNEDTDPATPQLRAIDAVNTFDVGFAEALQAGVTAVVTGPGSANPIGGQMVLLKTAGHRVDNMVVKEPFAMKMALGENPKVIYNSKNQSPVTRMATAAIIREQLLKARDYAEAKRRMEEDEESDDTIEYDFKCESLLPVLSGEMPVHFHAHRADDIYTAMRLAKEFHLNYVLVHATESKKVLDDLVEEQVPVIIGPVMTDRSKPELREQALDTAGILAKAGVATALCTDHPETPLKFYPVCAALCVRNGMDYMDALRAMTIVPARICGVEHRMGSLAPGKDADFVWFDGDPLSIYTHVELVAVDGKIAWQRQG